MYFYVRCLYGKDEVNGIVNHFGLATSKRPEGKLVWVHAASIGESTAALTYIKYLREQHPELSVLITTITVTSANIIKPKIEKIGNCVHQFVVADNPAWVKKFLDYWQPETAIFLESEIWPNAIDELNRRKIPIFLLNARLSQKSFDRWRYFSGFLSDTLHKFTAILAQSDIDAERFSFFSKSNVKRIDNLKYANEPLPCDKELLKVFQKLCTGKKVFVAASTHENEEEIILEAHKKLRTIFSIVTIIIPRHLTRVSRVCEIFQQQKVAFSLRSDPKNDSEVFCVDSFGEIGTFFRLADICFVGGSLVPVGGHNIYEPVALGKPVLHGPFMDNALEVRDLLTQKKVAFEVKNADDIFEICNDLFSDPTKLKQMVKLAAQIAKNESLKQIDRTIVFHK